VNNNVGVAQIYERKKLKSTLPSEEESALVRSVMSNICVLDSKPVNDNRDLNLHEINGSS